MPALSGGRFPLKRRLAKAIPGTGTFVLIESGKPAKPEVVGILHIRRRLRRHPGQRTLGPALRFDERFCDAWRRAASGELYRVGRDQDGSRFSLIARDLILETFPALSQTLQRMVKVLRILSGCR